jgi:hypothetical protein
MCAAQLHLCCRWFTDNSSSQTLKKDQLKALIDRQPDVPWPTSVCEWNWPSRPMISWFFEAIMDISRVTRRMQSPLEDETSHSQMQEPVCETFNTPFPHRLPPLQMDLEGSGLAKTGLVSLLIMSYLKWLLVTCKGHLNNKHHFRAF